MRRPKIYPLVPARESRTTAMQCNARCWQLSKARSEWHVTFLIFVCAFAGRPTCWSRCSRGSWRDAASPFLLDCICVFCRLPACHDAATAEYEDVCVSDRVKVCAWHLASSTTTLSGRVSRNPFFPFLSLRVATLPKPAPTPCSRKIYVKLVTQRHASHTNQPLTYVSTAQGRAGRSVEPSARESSRAEEQQTLT